ncbi:hypothetical protein HNE_0926 [Hyphomonas neptunium ATCC 15444]|uniref:Uncharacterized protein n=1 Tax=Hyphomonas neptunium (strain ATCC 15444) TaxID=228405 RepID=Q0C3P1_HYPNA|nr:hypothetical protein HNE_0926 [Hyphomonas neptunium ATCC 15444]
MTATLFSNLLRVMGKLASARGAGRGFGGPGRAAFLDHIGDLGPGGQGFCHEFDVEGFLAAELQHLDALGAGRVAIGLACADEETIACPECFGAKLERAGDDVVKAVRIVRMQRERKATLEPGMGEAETGAGEERLDGIAFGKASLQRAADAGLHILVEISDFHMPGLVERRRRGKTEDFHAGAGAGGRVSGGSVCHDRVPPSRFSCTGALCAPPALRPAEQRFDQGVPCVNE